MIHDLNNYNIEIGKDGRVRAYNKLAKTVTSYPRIIMENILNRKLLKTEDVHHKDGNPLNNNPDNLEVIDHREHDRIHGLEDRNRKYNDKEMICPICNKIFIWTRRQQSNYYSHNKTGSRPFCSKNCAGKYGKQIQERNNPSNKLISGLKRICPICGKEFIQSKTSQCKYNRGLNKFSEPVCSSACRFEYKRKFEKEKKFA